MTDLVKKLLNLSQNKIKLIFTRQIWNSSARMPKYLDSLSPGTHTRVDYSSSAFAAHYSRKNYTLDTSLSRAPTMQEDIIDFCPPRDPLSKSAGHV